MSYPLLDLQKPIYSLFENAESGNAHYARGSGAVRVIIAAYERHFVRDCVFWPVRLYSAPMNGESDSTERSRNLVAPWRMEYIAGLNDDSDESCFVCRYRDEADTDDANFVLWRGKHCFAMLNRYPYTGGHFMVAPYAHEGAMDNLEPAVLLEMMEMVRDLRLLLSHAIRAQGFNVGMNIGRCAGAGLPDHLHLHIVPRWAGDTNFMSVLGDARVIPQSLEHLLGLLKDASAELDLPKLSP